MNGLSYQSSEEEKSSLVHVVPQSVENVGLFVFMFLSHRMPLHSHYSHKARPERHPTHLEILQPVTHKPRHPFIPEKHGLVPVRVSVALPGSDTLFSG